METNEILVIYGNNPAAMAEHIACEADLAGLIGGRGARVGLKPNLVVASPADSGATTHPEIAAGLITYLKKNGFHNITILEGSWVGDSTARAFATAGYLSLAKETGVRLIDTQTDSAHTVNCRGMNIDICESALACDFIINLPVMKGHCQTLLTCALKNNKGLIPNREKRRFHSQGLHSPIAHLSAGVPGGFIMVDGICGDLDFEEGGNPVYGGRMFAGRDPVLVDAFSARLMGYDPREIPYIGLAESLGVGRAGPAIVRELNKSTEAAAPQPRGKVKQLAAHINEDSACSACYASLVFALSRLERAERARLGPIAIGQGFRGKTGTLGAGLCTAAFSASCPGCPPTGADVLAFLRSRAV